MNTLHHMHTELYIQVQPSCTCSVPHSPFYTCMIAVLGRLWKLQVVMSTLAHTGHHLSWSSPSWSGKVMKESLAVSVPICDLPGKWLFSHFVQVLPWLVESASHWSFLQKAFVLLHQCQYMCWSCHTTG